MTRAIQKKRIVFLIFGLFGFTLYAEEGVDTLLFPETNPKVIYIEGESAVSTNFALEPTLNYGASGSRTLQLNRSVGLQQGAAFYAEYAFYVEEAGRYTLWYGGTPPGPESDLQPSYTSTAVVTLDGGDPLPLFREDVFVRERYLPTYYWNEVNREFELSEGLHTLRFEIRDKRRYDGQYYFYIDSFFLLQSGVEPGAAAAGPGAFPEMPAGENNIPFRTVTEYEQIISGSPDEPEPYLELSYVYSLLGDYGNALITLRKLRLLYPDNPEYIILSAQNRLWKGDIQEGLRLYRQALSIDPTRRQMWNEAGKVAAWTGNYQESIRFYTDGLEQYPDDPSLLINLGITHLWKAEEEPAESFFLRAADSARGNLEAVLQLGRIYRVNGYPYRAESVYLEALRKYPLALEPYLELIEVYNSQGMTEKAEMIFDRIRGTMPSTTRLESYLNTFRKKQDLRERAIDEYRRRVEESPDNIGLRQLLVQTYFWNGLRAEAIREYLHILTNYAFRSMRELDAESSELLRSLDTAYLYLHYYEELNASLSGGMKETNTLLQEYADARKQYNTVIADEDINREDKNAAREAAAEVMQAAAGAITYWQERIDNAEAYRYAYSQGTGAIDMLQEQEQKDAERFETIFSQTGWSWDRTFHMDELEQSLSTAPELAGHVLGRIYQTEGKLQAAEQVFGIALNEVTPLPATAAALVETKLWSGDAEGAEALIESYREEITGYASYFSEIFKLLPQLTPDNPVSIALPSDEALEENYTELSKSAEEIQPLIDEMLTTIGGEIKILEAILYKRLVRKFYTLETNTYLLRYELGKYYIAEERYLEATEQLEKVLAIDPWNIDAQFRLGVVRQRYGDWKGAMRRYRNIYLQDPSYPNAAAYYNQLARQHPDVFTMQSKLLGDSSRISFSSDLSFGSSITSSLAWEGAYAFDGIRLYKTYGNEDPSSYQIHRAEIRLPVDLYFIDLTLTPGAGLYFSSDLFRENSLSTSEELLRMGYFLTLWQVSPVLFGNITFAPENLTLSAGYSWGPIEETFTPGRTLIRSHEISFSAYASLQGLDLPAFQYSSARINGTLDFAEDTNIIGTAVEEFNFGIHLFDSPWTTLIISETLSFEHSGIPSHTDDNGYYAPDSVLLFKGGLSASTWIPMLNQSVLGIILGASAGGYWEKLASDSPEPGALQLEFSGRLELGKGTNSYYLSANGSQTFRPGSGEILYWALQVSLGISAKPTLLLAP